ncbi:MAG: anion permease, partial [Proteobacteria bacterium]|nr:anion permease [Pseudomonadota bacterium]
MNILKNKSFQLIAAAILAGVIMLLPRPEGTRFEIKGDPQQKLLGQVQDRFRLVPPESEKSKGYVLETIAGSRSGDRPAEDLEQAAARLGQGKITIGYVNGLSPTAHRFLATLVFLIFMFVLEPIPLEVTALCIGVLLILIGVSDVKSAWAAYMHPVVLFIMCCLIFAIALDKAGLTKRMGQFVARKAGESVTRFTFILACGLGIASTVMHDAAATAIAIAAMLPLMRAAGIQPHTNTAKFMMLALPFACSSGGMGTLVGGGRCMVSAAFLKEFTGVEINFLDWALFAMPAALVTVPASVAAVWLVFRPDPSIKLPRFEDSLGPWTSLEKRTVLILAAVFVAWLTKSWHGLDYSVTGPLGVAALIMARVLVWEDI